ncbi:Uroporphyrinogen-III synthase / uroporphyrinogen-III C-methyltransferase [Syntrophobacter sp. SbD1]|nr:Uroporphyrinogen-III synthase / uroporphyrinogen-III C-methyltransferase [Syntrophobacter sp. SbD1]
MKRGKVYLVGAGPGDPGLFTLRGKEVLQRAEVVIFDYLANEELLKFAPPGAERIYVGKKGGNHTLGQEAINALLVEKGRENVVVRLKGGDPFIFGRGGEEAQALVENGIAFEAVPGISAAAAVPAYAGIPLSHRDFTSTIAFITGHERADKEEHKSKIAWDKISTGAGTLVFFMGVKSLPEICRNLIQNGRPADTPVALIRWGTTPMQKTVAGTLSDIVAKVKEANLQPPAMIVVGEVVKCREELNWFERRPLFGRKILITRAREQASDFKVELEELGAKCIEFPTIAIAPPPTWDPLDNAIRNLSQYDWAIFTSVNGVRFFIERLLAAGRDARDLKGLRLAAIGPKTAQALESVLLRPDLVPTEYRAEGLLEVFSGQNVSERRFLMPRALEAREVLPEKLRQWGAFVDVVPAYQTVLPEQDALKIRELLANCEIDCLTFTSSSTVSNFFSLIANEDLRYCKEKMAVACIGPVTAQTAEKFGLHTSIMPSEYTIRGLVDSIVSYFKN